MFTWLQLGLTWARERHGVDFCLLFLLLSDLLNWQAPAGSDTVWLPASPIITRRLFSGTNQSRHHILVHDNNNNNNNIAAAMALITQAKTRKEQRKEARKKRKRSTPQLSQQDEKESLNRTDKTSTSKRKKDNEKATSADNHDKKKKARKEGRDGNAVAKAAAGDGMDPDVTAAIRRDEEEIAALEAKLGLSKRNEKTRLYKEYSKLEGFGDDFGDFLEDLDDMVVRLQHPSSSSSSWSSPSRSGTKSVIERDDHDDDDDGSSTSSSNGEELMPMKEPFESFDEDDSVLEELERMEQEENEEGSRDETMDENILKVEDEQSSKNVNGDSSDDGNSSEGSDNDSDDDEKDNDENEAILELDHDVADTYRPTSGEDIYGNKIDRTGKQEPATKYVPPHVRKKQALKDEGDNEQRRVILRALNSALNRLSEDTLISVAQQVAQLYLSNPTKMVDELIWKNATDVCVNTPLLMSGLIPVYTACIAGVHIQTGDTVQVGEAILENVVVDLWKRLSAMRTRISAGKRHPDDAQEQDGESKQICNLTLILAYLYNYHIVHCSFIYDVIRQFIDYFSEIDIECLLLLLSHCGGSLRSDDALALKQIVLLVQKKTSEDSSLTSSSRAQYMVSAIMDLKNNRRKKQDSTYAERASKLRKQLGRIKSITSKSGVSKPTSESSLRISLEDILNAKTRGRWWRVGASWVGNQYQFSDDPTSDPEEVAAIKEQKKPNHADTEDEELIKLASKFRMNSDRKRSIFCIIMGGTDCEDTFEKLCRSSMLQNRGERDTVRVLMECCGNEKSYNKFYGHLASRICEYQPQSKFSLQLAYWDAFKQLESMSIRRVANLSKLLFHLIATHQMLRLLPVVKTLDISDNDLGENTRVFLTIVLSSILDYFDEPLSAKALFARQKTRPNELDEEEQEDKEEGARAGLLIFFMETLKSSPKNKKGSRFRKNFKAAVKALDTGGFEGMF